MSKLNNRDNNNNNNNNQKKILPKTTFNGFFSAVPCVNGVRITRRGTSQCHQTIPLDIVLHSGVHYFSFLPRKITPSQTSLSSLALSVLPTFESDPWPTLFKQNPFYNNFPGASPQSNLVNVASKAHFVNPQVLPDGKINMLTDSDAPKPVPLSGSHNSGHFSYCAATDFMIIQLDQPYEVDHFKILFWNGDSRTYTYTLHISPNNSGQWVPVVNSQQAQGWATVSYSGRVSQIKIQGTNTSNAQLHIIRFQIMAQPQRQESEKLLLDCQSCGFLNNAQYFKNALFGPFEEFNLSHNQLLQRKIGLLVDFPNNIVKIYLVDLENNYLQSRVLLSGISGMSVIPLLCLEHPGDEVELIYEAKPVEDKDIYEEFSKMRGQ